MISKTLFGAASLLAIVAATPASADCITDLRAFDDEVSAGNEYRVALTSQVRGDIRQLRDSAHILQQAGQEEACQEVVAAIKDMTENPETRAEQASYDEWNTMEVERLKTAQSLDQLTGRLRAERIIGSDVRNMQNEDLGEIGDLMLATAEGGTSYAIISHGGFLGLGEKQIAVPLKQLKVTEDMDVFVLDASVEQIANAPSFERGKFEAVSDEAWRKANDTYFGDIQ